MARTVESFSQKKNVQEGGGGSLDAQSDALWLILHAMIREIGTWMATGGIRFMEPSRMIQSTKWKINSLNEIIHGWGVNFV